MSRAAAVPAAVFPVVVRAAAPAAVQIPVEPAVVVQVIRPIQQVSPVVPSSRVKADSATTRNDTDEELVCF